MNKLRRLWHADLATLARTACGRFGIVEDETARLIAEGIDQELGGRERAAEDWRRQAPRWMPQP